MNMKMSDVFEGDVINDADTLIAHGYGELADFSGYKKECRYVAHAINNHDRLTSENARLINMLKRLTSHDNCRKDVIHLMSEADSLIQELEKGDE